MRDWWNWSQSTESDPQSFGIVGVGRFGSAVCRQLMQNGAEVLAVDRSSKAIEELRQLEPSIEARVVDCTDEESLREAGILDGGLVGAGDRDFLAGVEDQFQLAVSAFGAGHAFAGHPPGAMDAQAVSVGQLTVHIG